MAVAVGTLSALLVIEDGDSSPAAFNFTPAATPRGIIVRITSDGSANDRISGVTYGGVAMSRVVSVADTAGEPGRVYIYFLGSGIPTGTQSVSISHTTGSFKDVVVNSVTASADTEIGDFDSLIQDQASPQVTLTPAREAVAYCVIYSGLGSAASLTPVTGMTAERSVAFSFALRFDRQTTVSADPFTIGYTSASDDVAFAAVTVQEEGSAAQPLTGSLFQSAPTFFSGTVTPGAVNLAGQLFQKSPTFPTGAVTATYPVTGTLFQSAPSFFTGTVALDTTQAVTGTLFQQAPSFPTGTVTVGAVDLAGSLFQKAPTFPQGAITSTYPLTGNLFQSSPTFFAGIVEPGAAPLTGVLFQSTPVFFTGTVGVETIEITGVLFQSTPSFPTGTVTTTFQITGTLATFTATFPTGFIANRVPQGPAPSRLVITAPRFSLLDIEED